MLPSKPGGWASTTSSRNFAVTRHNHLTTLPVSLLAHASAPGQPCPQSLAPLLIQSPPSCAGGAAAKERIGMYPSFDMDSHTTGNSACSRQVGGTPSAQEAGPSQGVSSQPQCIELSSLLLAELAAARTCCTATPQLRYATAWTNVFLHWPCAARPWLA